MATIRLPACTALSFAAKPFGCRRFAPQHLRWKMPDQRSPAHLLVGLVRGQRPTATFLSPATTASLKATIAGSKIPVCRIDATLHLHETRSVCRSSSPAVSGWVGITAANPLFRSGSALPAYPRLPLPFRALRPVRIEAFHRFLAGKPAFRYRPIAFRSPQPPL